MALTVREAKQDLRRKMLERRRALTADKIAAGSAAMLRHLKQWTVYRSAGVVMLYLAMPDEAQTDALIADALAAGKCVCVPMLRAEYGLMDAAQIAGPDELITGKLGLKMPDPTKAKIIKPQDIDLIVVPGVAFDRHGHRLGMGAGYYDRFLPQAAAAHTLGMAWLCQLVEQVPRGQFDVSMQYLLTEGGLNPCS